MNMAEELRQAARNAGLTAYSVARDTGIRIAAIQTWLKGGGLKLTTAERIAGALGYRLELRPARRKAR